jgi:hypothetical protein
VHLCCKPHRTSASEARHMPHTLKTTLLKKLQANAFNFFFSRVLDYKFNSVFSHNQIIFSWSVWNMIKQLPILYMAVYIAFSIKLVLCSIRIYCNFHGCLSRKFPLPLNDYPNFFFFSFG